MPNSPLLQLQGVSRVLAGRQVVDNVNFELDRGSVLGLLGVNGAGKSTTLRMIAGSLMPSAGRVLVDGADRYEQAAEAGRQLGYLPERVPLYAELRVDEYLTFCARLHGLRGPTLKSAVDRALEQCDLGAVRRRLLGNLSKGFQQRTGIAAAIAHAPALIVLDEPASGLDPLQAVKIRALVRELGRESALILSTHQLADVEACCDRVAILHQGRLRHDGALRAGTADNEVIVALESAVDAAKWTTITCVKIAEFDGGVWRVQLAPNATAAQLAEAVVAKGWGLCELRGAVGSLEQIFLRIAGAADVGAADVNVADVNRDEVSAAA
jgi:ABC-2 type transport system ATP-binding protein